MNLFEELNKVLLEDKNRQFIASIEAFTAYDHPQSYYTYTPPTKSQRAYHMAAQVATSKHPKIIKRLYENNPPNRLDIYAKKLRIPTEIRDKWQKEIDDEYRVVINALKKRGYRGDKLDDLGKAEWVNVKITVLSTLLTSDEYDTIMAIGNNGTLFVGTTKEVETLLVRSAVESRRIAAQYIWEYIEDYVEKNVGRDAEVDTVDNLRYYLGQYFERGSVEWDTFVFFVYGKLAEHHVGFEGEDFESFIYDVINNIEEYPQGEESLDIAGKEKPKSVDWAKTQAAIEPTAHGRVRRNLTDLPRHDSDQRPTVADTVETAKIDRENGHLSQHSWIVITGYERSGYKGIKPVRRGKSGRWVGTCSYCGGSGRVGPSEGIMCPECAPKVFRKGSAKGIEASGEDLAWYWAGETGYEAHPENGGVEKQSLRPFDKVLRSVWTTLDSMDYNPEAFDGFERFAPSKGDDPTLHGAGKVITYDGVPVPQIYEYGANIAATNSPLFTAVIKLRGKIMGRKEKDLWNVEGPEGDKGRFQDYTEMLKLDLEDEGLGYEVDPINDKFDPEYETSDVKSGPVGSSYVMHVWDYVVEPGHLYRTSSDETLEQEFYDPEQAPYEQIKLALRVMEVAKHLDSIGFPQPKLWEALGLKDVSAIGPVQQLSQQYSFIDSIIFVMGDLKQYRKNIGSREINELHNIIKNYKKYDYKQKVLPHHIQQLARFKSGLEMMFYSHILGIPPSWNENVPCDKCGDSGDPECLECEGSGSKPLTKQRSDKGTIKKREQLAVRANRIEKIWDKLSKPEFDNIEPHNALRMGLGLYWDVPDEYQRFLEQKIKKQQEAEEARGDPYPEKIMVKLRLKGGRGGQFAAEWMPIKYIEVAKNDLAKIIVKTKDQLSENDLDELRAYYAEINSIHEKAEWRLLDPAFKKRIRRAEKAMEKWEKYGKPEEKIKMRSRDISTALVKFAFAQKVGRIDRETCLSDPDCLDKLIFMEIHKLVTGRNKINGIETKYLWLRQNLYKSFLVVKDEIEQWVIQRADIPPEYTLDGLVSPGTGHPIPILQRIYKTLSDLNSGVSFDKDQEREELVSRAFQAQTR